MRIWNHRITKKKLEGFEKNNPAWVLAGSDLDNRVEKLAGLINKDLLNLKELFVKNPKTILLTEDIISLLETYQSDKGSSILSDNNILMSNEIRSWLDTFFTPVECRWIDGYLLIEEESFRAIMEESNSIISPVIDAVRKHK